MSLTTEPTQATTYASPVTMPVGSFTQPAKHEVSPAAEEKRGSPSPDELKKIVDDINANLRSMNTELNFSVDKDSHKVVLKIVNSKTHEVVRQIPPEDTLRIASKLSKLMGLLVDGNA